MCGLIVLLIGYYVVPGALSFKSADSERVVYHVGARVIAPEGAPGETGPPPRGNKSTLSNPSNSANTIVELGGLPPSQRRLITWDRQSFSTVSRLNSGAT